MMIVLQRNYTKTLGKLLWVLTVLIPSLLAGSAHADSVVNAATVSQVFQDASTKTVISDAKFAGGGCSYGQGTYYAQSYYYSQGAYTSGSGGASGVASRTFTYTGSTQSFQVPTGVTSLRVVVVGGGGGGGGGAADWGGSGGGGCGGGVAAQTLTVTPGQTISVITGAGGAGGANNAYSGAAGGASQFGTVSAAGGSYGRSGYYGYPNTTAPAGGAGGGSWGGGGGNAYPGFYAVPGSGGTNGSNTTSLGSGSYCTGSGWSVNLSSYITKVSYAPGTGGYAPASYAYCGGGGGGGLVIDGSTVSGASGLAPTSSSYGPGCAPNGGQGYGAGGGGSFYSGGPAYGGAGAPGVVYIEWADQAPSAPITSGPTSLGLSVSGTYSFVSTDPEAETVRYAIDWDNNGSTDEYAPTSGYVASGASASATHSWGTTGTKTFQARAIDSTGKISGWTSYAVAVSDPSPVVLLTASPSSISTGQSSTLTWSSSYATSCTGTNFSTGGAVSGSVSVSPTVSTTYTVNCTGSGGAGSSAKTVTYTCTPSNICSNGNVVNSCTGATVQTCSYQCGAGACISPPPPETGEFGATNGGAAFTASGHLQAKPQLVRSGAVTYVYWNLTNVSSCAVTGSNGNSWTGSFSGTAGKTSLPIVQRTTFTLSCTGLDSSTVTESQVVNVIPVFQEQ